MSERPFMQLYVSDFLGDTLELSTEGIGAYMLLLMAMWNAGGTLPDDEAKLARITRMSIKKWRAIATDLMKFFDVSGGAVRSRHLDKWLRDERRLSGRPPLSAVLRQSILQRDGERCRYCGTYEGPFHIDHIYPVALGGSDDPDNLTVACAHCNMSKGAKPLEVWLQ